MLILYVISAAKAELPLKMDFYMKALYLRLLDLMFLFIILRALLEAACLIALLTILMCTTMVSFTCTTDGAPIGRPRVPLPELVASVTHPRVLLMFKQSFRLMSSCFS
jgi:hypothetical protein